MHDELRNHDFMFQAYDSENCANFLKFGENLVKKNNEYMVKFNKIIEKNPLLIDVRKDILGNKEIVDQNINCAVDIYLFMDYIISMRNYGIKEFLTNDELNKEIDYMNMIANYYKSLYFFEQKAMSVQLTKLAKDIWDNMSYFTGKDQHKPDENKQIPFILYSGIILYIIFFGSYIY